MAVGLTAMKGLETVMRVGMAKEEESEKDITNTTTTKDK